jgi:hypothetical protein
MREQVGVVLDPSEASTVASSVRALSDAREDYRERLRRAREQVVYAFGRSHEVGAEVIAGLLRSAGQEPG